MNFYRCNECGSIITDIKECKCEGCSYNCCNRPMAKLNANSVDAAIEKHVPVVENSDNVVTVRVGEVAHPMIEEHFIEFIALETTKGMYLRKLNPGEEAGIKFTLDNEVIVKAYAYCNLHGLWSSK